MNKTIIMMAAALLMAGCSNDDEEQKVEPRATVSESGFHARGNQAGSQNTAIRQWLEGLGLAK